MSTVTLRARERAGIITRAAPGRPILAVLMTAGQKRDGYDLDPRGANLSRYRRNPVLMTLHDRQKLPVGRVENIDVHDDRIEGELRFAKSDPFAQQCEALVREEIINAVSIGFEPDSMPDQRGRVAKWTYIETSLVGVPLDEDAIIYARSLNLAPGDLRAAVIAELDKLGVPIPGDPRTYRSSGRRVDARGARQLLGVFDDFQDSAAKRELQRAVRRYLLAAADAR